MKTQRTHSTPSYGAFSTGGDEPNVMQDDAAEGQEPLPGADLEGEADVLDDEGPTDAETAAERAKIKAMIEQLGVEAKAMIKEAVGAREASGVEARWDEDLGNFYGSDSDALFRTVVDRAAKLPTANLGNGEKNTVSAIGVNIVRPKVNTAAARLVELSYPTDERNFGLKSTPNPTLSKALIDASKVVGQAPEQPIVDQGGQPMISQPVADAHAKAAAANKEIEEANRAASAMERTIDDQLSECGFVGEARGSKRDLVIFGTTIIGGPFPKEKINRSYEREDLPDGSKGKWKLKITKALVPYSRRVPPPDFYPDPAGRGDMKKCRYAVERILYNTRTLGEVKGSPGALDDEIEELCKTGPRGIAKTDVTMTRRYLEGDYQLDYKNLFEGYLVHGMFDIDCVCAATGKNSEAMSDDNPDGLPESFADRKQVPGCVLVVQDRIVKVYLNPLDTGDLPYDMEHYEKVDGQPWGIGIPFILRNAQRVVRTAWRMVMENAAQNVGGQLVVNKELITPANGSWKMTGGKVWFMTPRKGGESRVDHAFWQWNPTNGIADLLKIIEFALKFAEDETSLPDMMAGHKGEQTPTTLGGQQLADQNSNDVIMRLVRQGDDESLKPHLTRYYDWNMQHNDDDSIKGDMQIIPLSATALRARTIEAQAVAGIGQYVVNPSFAGFHKRKGYDWLRKAYQLQRLTPDDVLITPDEVDAMIEEAKKNPPPEDPQVQIARLQIKADQENMAAKLDHDKNAKLLDYKLGVMKYADARSLSAEEANAELARLIITNQHEQTMRNQEIVAEAQSHGNVKVQ